MCPKLNTYIKLDDTYEIGDSGVIINDMIAKELLIAKDIYKKILVMMNNNRNIRIANNVILMYIRMAVIMIINLYTVRVLLNILGRSDYGIYYAVAGIISILYCVNNVLSSATQRFYSLYIEKNTIKTKQIFINSIFVIFILSLFVFFISETIGLWIIKSKLSIPEQRLDTAIVLYHFTILSYVLTLMSIPFSAAIIAHEHMGLFSIITTTECILKLLSALVLILYSGDKLFLYGIAIFVSQLALFSIYCICSRIRYAECHFDKLYDKKLLHELFSFSSWSFYGSMVGALVLHVNTMIISSYFGPLITASRGISVQVYSALTSFCNSFIVAIKPPMMKSYSDNNDHFIKNIYYLSNKFIFSCMLIFCLPIMVETKGILSYWLKINDSTTILFVRLMLIYALVISLHEPSTILIQASGKVKEYHLKVDSLFILCIPITLILYHFGFPAYSTFIVMDVIILLSHFVRLYCVRKIFKYIKISYYVNHVVIKGLIVLIMTSIPLFLANRMIESLLPRFVLCCVWSIIGCPTISYLYYLDNEEKKIVVVIVKNILGSLWKKMAL